MDRAERIARKLVTSFHRKPFERSIFIAGRYVGSSATLDNHRLEIEDWRFLIARALRKAGVKGGRDR